MARVGAAHGRFSSWKKLIAGKERQAQLGAGGETAEVLFPLRRPTSAAQVQHADALDRVTRLAQIERRRGGTPFTMNTQKIV